MECDDGHLRSIEILLVEDNASDLELTLRAFQVHHLTNTVHVVRDGEQALKFLFGDAGVAPGPLPDLVLLDLRLPKVSGKEVLARVRAEPRTAGLPVIVFTSSTEDGDFQECMALGANAYIVKPTDFGQFALAVRRMGLQWTLLAPTGS
jgi:two-component system, response regulator